MEAKSLYIHIPFCKRRCVYCNFYSTIYDESLAASYIDVLSKQIDGIDAKFDTVYIGGGTPTVLGKNLLERLLRSLKERINNASEFTLEANPESVDEDKLKLLLDYGVNRLSIGVQSIKDQKLKRLGRIHDSRKAGESVRRAKKTGFDNISIDLIFGVWAETIEAWESDIKEAVKLPISHISCYALTYEKDTPLWGAVRNGSVKPLDDEKAAEMYEKAIDLLSLRGFKQYEVSNFSQEGYECKHNMTYWNNDSYIGLGASSVSYIKGVREENVSSVEEYIKRFEDSKTTVVSSEKLSPVASAKETAAIKIRTKEGIDFDWFKNKTGFDFIKLEKRAIKGLVRDGFVKYIKTKDATTGICLRCKGFLFCDTVSSAFL